MIKIKMILFLKWDETYLKLILKDYGQKSNNKSLCQFNQYHNKQANHR